MTENKGFYTKKVDELEKNFNNITKDYKSVEDAVYVSNALGMLSIDLLKFAREMAESIDNWNMEKSLIMPPYLKPDTPENVGVILRAIDKDLIVNRITTVDGVLNSFEVGTAAYLMGIVKKDSDGYWNFQTYLGSRCINKYSETESEVTIENDKVKELSEILPVINEFIELQEAKDEQDL